MFLRIFRPDKIIPMIQKLIKKEKQLGANYIRPPAFDMEKSYDESSSKTPIIIILSSGADPMSEMIKLSEKNNVRVVSISLGKGQGQIAVNAIQNAIERQEWIVLQNCHLSPSFMPTLDGQIEDIKEDREKISKFRMWLTSESSPKFPVTILQNSVKATIEPPKGIKNNLMRSYLGIDKTEFEECDKPGPYKSLMWGLCFFNAVVLERRKFGPLGWNIPYQFSGSDLSISQAQLKMFLNFYDLIPWDALRYMVAEANYGGRVTDVNDRLTIMLILEDFYNPKMLNHEHPLVESGKYIVPAEGDVQSYIDYIDGMSVNDYTEIFGLNDNAEITSAINATNDILDAALSVQNAVAITAGAKTEDEYL